jgi:hypothetical protein
MHSFSLVKDIIIILSILLRFTINPMRFFCSIITDFFISFSDLFTQLEVNFQALACAPDLSFAHYARGKDSMNS